MKSGKKNNQLRIGLIITGSVLLFILLSLIFADITTDIRIERRLERPLAQSFLGTDDLGRDLHSCIVVGTMISLVIGIAVVVLSASAGGLLGMVSGLAGDITDIIIMRIVDIILSFPGILLAIAMAFFFRQGMISIILILTFTGWVGYARLIRGEVLKYKQMEFILAARAYNASFGRIIFSHLRPLVLPLLCVQASLAVSGVILAESSLNFLGLGLPPQIPTLGQLIDTGRAHIFDRPFLIIIPGTILFLLIIGFNFIGEGLRKKYTR